MGTRAGHQRRQAGHKIERLKQASRRAVAKRALEFVHDQAVAIDGQSLVRHRPPRVLGLSWQQTPIRGELDLIGVWLGTPGRCYPPPARACARYHDYFH